MTESAIAMPGGVSPPQSKLGSTTTERGRAAPSRAGRAGAVAGQVRARRRVTVIAAVDGLRPRVQQQLGLIGPQPRTRIPRPVDPVAVALPGTDPRHVGVPHVAGARRQRQHGLGAVIGEQAQAHSTLTRRRGVHREVRARRRQASNPSASAGPVAPPSAARPGAAVTGCVMVITSLN